MKTRSSSKTKENKKFNSNNSTIVELFLEAEGRRKGLSCLVSLHPIHSSYKDALLSHFSTYCRFVCCIKPGSESKVTALSLCSYKVQNI
jgi:hypothetical protein